MNNKGQVLVIFVILIPIFIILLTLVVDLGTLYIEKRNISNNVTDAVEYYLENKDDINIEEKVKELLNKNISDIGIDVTNTNDYVEITVSKRHKSIYTFISKDNDINITYRGLKNSNKIIKG